jgi:hypothetical protein
VKRNSGGGGEGEAYKKKKNEQRRGGGGRICSNHFLSFAATTNDYIVMSCIDQNIVYMMPSRQNRQFNPTTLDAITRKAKIPGKIQEGVEISHANLFIYMLVAGSIFYSPLSLSQSLFSQSLYTLPSSLLPLLSLPPSLKLTKKIC